MINSQAAQIKALVSIILFPQVICATLQPFQSAALVVRVKYPNYSYKSFHQQSLNFKWFVMCKIQLS